MTVEQLMDEYGLSMNDIRWYLCSQITFGILELTKTPDDITSYLWSGKLEADLYNIEEKFIAALKEEMEKEIKTEAEIRDIFSSAVARRDNKIKYM